MQAKSLDAGSLSDCTWTPQYVVNSKYGANVFTIINNYGYYWFAKNGANGKFYVDADTFPEFYSYLDNTPASSDQLLWQIELNTTEGSEGYLYYSMKSCLYGQYVNMYTYSPYGIIMSQLSPTLQSGCWWTAMVSPARLEVPLLTNALIDDGNGGVAYLSITPSSINLTNVNDDVSTNLYLINGETLSIPCQAPTYWSKR